MTQLQILELLKKNAPSVYTSYCVSKRRSLEIEIAELRVMYAETSDEAKRAEITKEATKLKDYLSLLRPEVAQEDTKAVQSGTT